jgi:hypothetical protein
MFKLFEEKLELCHGRFIALTVFVRLKFFLNPQIDHLGTENNVSRKY